MQIKRFHSYQLTVLELNGPEMDIEVRMVSRFPKAQRRWVALSFLRQIRPWLSYFRSKTLEHKAPGRRPTPRALERGIFVPKGTDFRERDAKIGYEIRSKRLELGLSQAELASEVGVARTHLSAIERGLHQPKGATRESLLRRLAISDRADVRKKPDIPEFKEGPGQPA